MNALIMERLSGYFEGEIGLLESILVGERLWFITYATPAMAAVRVERLNLLFAEKKRGVARNFQSTHCACSNSLETGGSGLIFATKFIH